MMFGHQSAGVSLGPAQMDDIRGQDSARSISYTTREGTRSCCLFNKITWLSKGYQDIYFSCSFGGILQH